MEELRALQNPTTQVKHIFQAFCMLLQLKPKRLPKPDGSISNDYFQTFQKFVKRQPTLKSLLHLDFNLYAISQETLFLVNQYLYLLLSRELSFESL